MTHQRRREEPSSFPSPLSYLSFLSSGRSVKWLLAFASTVIPDFDLLENHDQDLYSGLDMFVFRIGGLFFEEEVSLSV
jgi:hypothetical protein